MKEEMTTYAAIIVAAGILGWTLYGAFSTPTNQQQATPTECGDVTDNANIQHLSHHPDRYAECIKLVEPAKFKEAVGMDKSQYLKLSGIQ